MGELLAVTCECCGEPMLPNVSPLGACPGRSARPDAPVETSLMRPLPGSDVALATREPSRDRPARSTNGPGQTPRPEPIGMRTAAAGRVSTPPALSVVPRSSRRRI
jgi:hypothetical protein